MDFTSESLEKMLIELNKSADGVGERIAAKPARLIIPRKLLRVAILIMRCEHKKHMVSLKQRKASKRAKARQHASFIYPRRAA